MSLAVGLNKDTGREGCSLEAASVHKPCPKSVQTTRTDLHVPPDRQDFHVLPEVTSQTPGAPQAAWAGKNKVLKTPVVI